VIKKLHIVPRQNFPYACVAAKILCESLLARLPTILKGNHPIISVKSYINIIQVYLSINGLFFKLTLNYFIKGILYWGIVAVSR
jgi:hypothetical protein